MSDVIDIYHGSPKVIEQPVFGAGKVHNDYGRGFYCTEHIELAKEWACSADTDGYANRRTKQEQRPSSLGLCLARRRKTIVNHYQLDTKGLTVLNLNTPEYNILNWLAILLENRKLTFGLLPSRLGND